MKWMRFELDRCNTNPTYLVETSKKRATVERKMTKKEEKIGKKCVPFPAQMCAHLDYVVRFICTYENAYQIKINEKDEHCCTLPRIPIYLCHTFSVRTTSCFNHIATIVISFDAAENINEAESVYLYICHTAEQMMHGA